jgi:hypothetical protein
MGLSRESPCRGQAPVLRSLLKTKLLLCNYNREALVTQKTQWDTTTAVNRRSQASCFASVFVLYAPSKYL